MGALAEKRWDDCEAEATTSAATDRPRSLQPLEGSETPPSSPRWNVLAEELVSFPPRHQRIWLEPRSEPSEASRAYADAWLDKELEELARRRRQGLARTAAAPLEAAPVRRSVPTAPALRPRPTRAVPARRTTPSSPARTPRTKTRGKPVAKRGLRRLLPGVATLAVFASCWFGVGSLAASAHSGPIVRLPGSSPVAGGYSYVVQPGDTLWSIASAVEPGRDPRALVDRLEHQIGGGVLEPGERLILPR